jgi:transcriptional regulator with XRE-family HTH domain
MLTASAGVLQMSFAERLVHLRKNKGLTQQALAGQAGVHVMQIRRYEGGHSQPTLEVIRQLAIALSVSTDWLIFEQDERGPDEELRLQFEAISQFDPEEKKVVKSVLDGLILKHQVRRWGT